MRRGFTLIELLVVITIIAILAGLGIPAITSAIKKAQQTKSASNLSQIGRALLAYSGDNNNQLPIAGGIVKYGDTFQPDSGPKIPGWQEQIEAYIPEKNDVFTSPLHSERKYGYFLGTHAVRGDVGAEFAPLNLLRLKSSSRHIIGGEVIYWTNAISNPDQDDADKDDYTQNPAFGNGNTAKASDGSNPTGKAAILFGDGHIELLEKFDSKTMSVKYEGVDNPDGIYKD